MQNRLQWPANSRLVRSIIRQSSTNVSKLFSISIFLIFVFFTPPTLLVISTKRSAWRDLSTTLEMTGVRIMFRSASPLGSAKNV